eukprot:7662252-Pyramimonas_sp.AAC.1
MSRSGWSGALKKASKSTICAPPLQQKVSVLHWKRTAPQRGHGEFSEPRWKVCVAGRPARMEVGEQSAHA